MKRNNFELTNKQKESFVEVIKAIEKANKTGLVFYGKGGTLCAYQRKAMKYAAPSHETNKDYKNSIPFESAMVLADSGADDTEYFEMGIIE